MKAQEIIIRAPQALGHAFGGVGRDPRDFPLFDPGIVAAGSLTCILPTRGTRSFTRRVPAAVPLETISSFPLRPSSAKK
jgi:hypothetical protein